jgi:hypothetical protein
MPPVDHLAVPRTNNHSYKKDGYLRSLDPQNLHRFPFFHDWLSSIPVPFQKRRVIINTNHTTRVVKTTHFSIFKADPISVYHGFHMTPMQKRIN